MPEKLKHHFDVQINSIKQSSNNIMHKEVEFILHDFNISHNYAFITKESAEKALSTLQNAPIVCKYHPSSSVGSKDDALGSHEVRLDKSREDGDEFVTMDTVAIGTFTEPAYFKTIEVNGEEVEVVAGKGVLWASRYPNVVSLMQEWVDEGISVGTSMEILYDAYEVKDGITEIKNYIFDGHCILNSKQVGEHNIIKPAYDVSKMTKLIAEAVHQDEKEEEIVSKENKELETQISETKVIVNEEVKVEGKVEGEESEKVESSQFELQTNALSFDAIRELAINAVRGNVENGAYIIEIYSDKFIVEIYDRETYEDMGYFQYNYVLENDQVVVDFNSKQEVERKVEWVNVERQMNQLKSDKEALETQLNEVNEKVLQLNSQVEEMKPIHEEYITAKFNDKLNEVTELYSAKFNALGASDKFESEEVQSLISEMVKNEDDVTPKLQLNSMLVDLVVIEKVEKKEEPAIRQLSSRREDLIPVNNDFESRYK